MIKKKRGGLSSGRALFRYFLLVVVVVLFPFLVLLFLLVIIMIMIYVWEDGKREEEIKTPINQLWETREFVKWVWLDITSWMFYHCPVGGSVKLNLQPSIKNRLINKRRWSVPRRRVSGAGAPRIYWPFVSVLVIHLRKKTCFWLIGLLTLGWGGDGGGGGGGGVVCSLRNP